MTKIGRAFLVLFAFVIGPCYLHAADTTSVTFELCNAGKADVDVFFSHPRHFHHGNDVVVRLIEIERGRPPAEKLSSTGIADHWEIKEMIHLVSKGRPAVESRPH